MLPSLLGGVKKTLRLSERNRSRSVTSAALIDWRANGAGLTGIGCVGQARSPRKSDAGTARSTTSNNGFPVCRSNRKTKPLFAIWATASIRDPPRVTVTRLGAAGRSRSQRS